MLLHATEVAPDDGYVKFLNLAQLSSGRDALGFYEAATRILKRDMGRAEEGAAMAAAAAAAIATADADGAAAGTERRLSKGERAAQKRIAALRREIASTCVAAAELFLTDLCDEPEAESACERLTLEAVATAPNHIEAHQTLGSLRLSQLRPEDAHDALLTAARLTQSLGEDEQPTYDSKVELARLLMQVDLRVCNLFLLGLLNLDDSIAVAWFLIGECARMRKKFVDAARFFRRARLIAQHQGETEVLGEIDAAIGVLIADMGGEGALATIGDLDHPNPIDVMEMDPEEDDEDDAGDDAEGAAAAAHDESAAEPRAFANSDDDE
jgi:tetratricopeptide (TPR) repeat protein